MSHRWRAVEPRRRPSYSSRPQSESALANCQGDGDAPCPRSALNIQPRAHHPRNHLSAPHALRRASLRPFSAAKSCLIMSGCPPAGLLILRDADRLRCRHGDTIPRPSRRRGRSGSRASASTRAPRSCTSSSGRRGAGANASRSALPPSQYRRRRGSVAGGNRRRRLRRGRQQVLAETQGAVLPLVPYLNTLRWLFIAVALGGVAVAIFVRLDDWKKGRR